MSDALLDTLSREERRAHQEAIDAIPPALAALYSALHWEQVARHRHDLNALSQVVSGWRELLDGQLREIAAGLTRAAAERLRQSESLAAIHDAIAAQERRLDLLVRRRDAEVADLRAADRRHDGQLAAVEARLDRLEAEIEELRRLLPAAPDRDDEGGHPGIALGAPPGSPYA